MKTPEKVGCALLVSVTALGSGCGRPGEILPQPSPVPALAGTYALTVRRPDHCNETPGLPDTLRYHATLESTPFAYTSIRVRGEGYSQPTGVGEVWHPSAQRTLWVSWNIFDVGGCGGGYSEIINGTSRMICGEGPARLDGSIIVAQVEAEAVIYSERGPSTRCSGHFTFTFEPI